MTVSAAIIARQADAPIPQIATTTVVKILRPAPRSIQPAMTATNADNVHPASHTSSEICAG
jgi:hypothetical protein